MHQFTMRDAARVTIAATLAAIVFPARADAEVALPNGDVAERPVLPLLRKTQLLQTGAVHRSPPGTTVRVSWTASLGFP